jgi:hypothetical protein
VGGHGTGPRQTKFPVRWRQAWLTIVVGLAIVLAGLRCVNGDAAGALSASPEATATAPTPEETSTGETPEVAPTESTVPHSEGTATAVAAATSTPTQAPALEQTATTAPPTEPAGQPTLEPTPTSTPRTEPTANPPAQPTATPTPAPKSVNDSEAETSSPRAAEPVRIEVRSTDGTVGPGGSVVYHFRLTNPSTISVRFRLVASLDRADWSVTIAEPTGLITLQPDQARDVTVVVAAPDEALAGEQATLRLTAINEAGVEVGG